MAGIGKKIVYNGEFTTVTDFAAARGLTPKIVYRYYKRHGNLDGFDDRRSNYPKKVEYNGERLTFREIAARLNVSIDTARRHYNRNGSFDECGINRTSMPWLQRFYNTLDKSIPLDRCILSAGYRSIHQFCASNDLRDSLVGYWRRGKPFMHSGRSDYLTRRYGSSSILYEMTNFSNGISIPLYKIMLATGCLEWELFPNIFTADFYDAVYRGYSRECGTAQVNDSTVEDNERKAVIDAVLRTLSKTSRDILKLAYGLGGHRECTHKEIARLYGFSREWVRQVILRAFRKLRRSPARMRLLREVF